MSYEQSFNTILEQFPAEVQADSDFRAVLVLGGKLAAELGGSGNANPATAVGDFLATHLAADPFAVAKYRAKLNQYAERYGKGR